MDVTNQRKQQFEHLAAEIFEPLQRYLLRRVHHDEVDDVLSETLLVIWRRLEDVPRSEPLPWCYGVARRTLANNRRSATRRLRLVERVSAQPTMPIDDVGLSDIEDPDLLAAFDLLSDEDRDLFQLWAWEQLEPREIALVLETTSNAVSLRLKRAKQRLASELLRQKTMSAGHNTEKHAQEM
ncbi:MAG: sigma-70 family RNA polymerase sigma factor [Acidimicrobiia bacterium]|nr:sigma-70 family RNA polymerase sigma factor [Acidimicrobiia bacterium]MDH3462305.1 sigma-70 family RNA polymerase sigma factor [Acidimicrobiia bacterium]